MAYATIADVQSRMTRIMTGDELTTCKAFLDDIAILIDAYNPGATDEIKRVVSCRAIIRALGDGSEMSIPFGASQGSMSALGYSQSWTIGSGGAVGELYLSKTEKKMLGTGNSIGSHSPVEDLVANLEDWT